MLKLRTAIKMMVELFLTRDQKRLLKIQRSSSVLDSEAEDTVKNRLAASMMLKGKQEKESTHELLARLVAEKERLDLKTLKLLDGALNAPNRATGWGQRLGVLE